MSGGRRAPLRWRRPVGWDRQPETWRQADPALIAAESRGAEALPDGNWYVAGPSHRITAERPLGCRVAGVEVVLWRAASGLLVAGPGGCPHLGAPLAEGAVRCGTLVCRWHGLRLDGRARHGWSPFPAFDDGVLAWVRLDAVGGGKPWNLPGVPDRPPLTRAVHAVFTGRGVCEPRDVVANRLDPWHGGWLHPYFFTDLDVLPPDAAAEAPESPEPADPAEPANSAEPAESAEAAESAGGSEPDGRRGTGIGTDASGHNASGPDAPDAEPRKAAEGLTVTLSFKVAGRLVAPVRAVFTAPGPRTVVMRITDGDGRGSVVETHATPYGTDLHGRPVTSVVEAVIAVSGRPGFALLRHAGPALRPLIRRASARLWRDDLAYAERRWALRAHSLPPD